MSAKEELKDELAAEAARTVHIAYHAIDRLNSGEYIGHIETEALEALLTVVCFELNDRAKTEENEDGIENI